MRILVLGASGMLGHGLHRVLHDGGHDVVGSVRRDSTVSTRLPAALQYVRTGTLSELGELTQVLDVTRPQLVVNAAGLIKQLSGDANELVAINALMPRRLACLAGRLGLTVVHFSTDCVFRGTRGSYVESDCPDADDAYGVSKFLGELTDDRCLTLRTSIIGRGLVPNPSLVDWFLGAKGEVKGYRRAVFSGLPVDEIGRFLLRILPDVTNRRLRGLYHLAAAPIDKFTLLGLLKARWGKHDVEIRPDEGVRIDRSLDASKLRSAAGYVADGWEQLVDRMHVFYERESKRVD